MVYSISDSLALTVWSITTSRIKAVSDIAFMSQLPNTIEFHPEK